MNLDAVGRLEKKVVASDGWLLRAQLAAVARTYRVFLGNDRELQRYLAAHREPEAALRLWDTRNQDSFERFLDEVDRLLHNYLASVAALRDHTRHLWQKHPPADEALRSAYTARVTTTFAASPGCAFIQDLRNFSLHRRLTLARGRLSFSPQAGLDAAVILVRQDFESWDGWKAPAREYLNAAPDEIDLAEVVSSYTSAVVEFNDWFGQAFVKGDYLGFVMFSRRSACSGWVGSHGRSFSPIPGQMTVEARSTSLGQTSERVQAEHSGSRGWHQRSPTRQAGRSSAPGC